jgi:thiol-disulfide isomerase/thioredoxin
MSPRNVAVVACYIASLLPENQDKFRKEIVSYVTNDLAYRSPETLFQTEIWCKFQYIINKYIQELDEEWKKEIIDIYVGNSSIPEDFGIN